MPTQVSGRAGGQTGGQRGGHLFRLRDVRAVFEGVVDEVECDRLAGGVVETVDERREVLEAQDEEEVVVVSDGELEEPGELAREEGAALDATTHSRVGETEVSSRARGGSCSRCYNTRPSG